MLDLDQIERVLVVEAHPDDVDFGVAGIVARLTSHGVRVSYCIVTDGDAGGSDRSISRLDMAAMRRAEQTAAAKVLGVDDVVFLGYPDGRLQVSLELRRDISRVIREVRPQVVICQSPERNLDRIFASHPDHLAAGEAAMSAVYPDARNPFAFPELLESGLEPWTVAEVWLQGHARPTDAVDVTEFVSQKFEALLCHDTQHPEPDAMRHRVAEWMVATGRAFSLPEGRSAEAVRVGQTG